MARIVDFFDGAQSETTPTIGNILASGIICYADDAEYEANELGAPFKGSIYQNGTTGFLRYYNGTTWIDIVDDESLQTIINKTIDADLNTITNIDNDEIKVGAAIDVTKLHDGSVDNTEFSYLDGVTSAIQPQIDSKQDLSEKGQPNGYASLDGSGTVPAAQLPSFVDDVLEFADLASFPATGETGKIYVALDSNKTYRWSGSTYIEISAGVTLISDLDDVDLVGLADQDIMIYNSTSMNWEPSPVPVAVSDLSDLGDVDTTGVAQDDILVYNATNMQFEPSPVPSNVNELSDLTDVDTTGVALGDVLVYNDVSMQFEPQDVSTQTFVNMTDWESFPLVYSSGNSGSAMMRRVGDSLEVEYTVAFTGTGINQQMFVDLPAGLTADASKMTGISINEFSGTALWFDNSGSAPTRMLVLEIDNTGQRLIHRSPNDGNGFNSASCAAGDVISGRYTVPILGWDSTNILSTLQSDLQTASTRAEGAPTNAFSSSSFAYNVLTYPNIAFEDGVAYNPSTGTFTILESGKYEIKGGVQVNYGAAPSTSGIIWCGVYVNGLDVHNGDQFFGNSFATEFRMSCDVLLELNAGDTVQIYQRKNQAQTLTVSGDSRSNYASVARKHDLTAYGVVKNEEYLESLYVVTADNGDGVDLNPGTTEFNLTLPAGTWDVGYMCSFALQSISASFNANIFITGKLHLDGVLIEGTESVYAVDTSLTGGALIPGSATTRITTTSQSTLSFKYNCWRSVGNTSEVRARMVARFWTSVNPGFDSAPKIWARRIK